jgi:hypothetical protein
MCQNCIREFEVFTAVTVMSTVLWDAMLSSLIEVYRCFRGMYCLHLQVEKISQASNQYEAHRKLGSNIDL